MAVNRISGTAKVDAYRNVAKPAPTPEVEVVRVAPTGSVPERSTPAQLSAESRPVPYVNTRGETTGTVVNTAA